MNEEEDAAQSFGNVGTLIDNNYGTIHINHQFAVQDQLHIHLPPAVPRPKIKVVIQPGPECIGDTQKSRLKALVAEVLSPGNQLRPHQR